jgi:hypothetical protein
MISKYDPEELGDIEKCEHLILEIHHDAGDEEDEDTSEVDMMIHVDQGPPSGERFLSLGFKKG